MHAFVKEGSHIHAVALLVATAFLLVLAAPSAVFASSASDEDPVSVATGPYVFANVGSHAIAFTEGSSRSGVGFMVGGGYGFTDRLGVTGGYSFAGVTPEQDLSHLEVALRLSFRSGQDRYLPFVFAGPTRVALSQPIGDASTSLGAKAGGGFQYFIADQFAVDGQAHLAFSSFSNGPSSDQAFTTRFAIGVAWFPTR